MFRLHVLWMFVIFQSLFITQVSASRDCEEQDFTPGNANRDIINLNCPARRPFHGEFCCWLVTSSSTKENEFIRVTFQDGSDCYSSSIAIYDKCQKKIIFQDYYCEKETRTEDVKTDCEEVKVLLPNCEYNCFNVEFTTGKDEDDIPKWIVIGLPVVLLCLTILAIILLVSCRCKKLRKRRDNRTIDKTSQSEAAISTPHQRKQGIELDMKNSVTTERETNENLDHLEGDGVEVNPVYASGADCEQNGEHAYQTVESNDEMKQHEYSYIDPKSMSAREN